MLRRRRLRSRGLRRLLAPERSRDELVMGNTCPFWRACCGVQAGVSSACLHANRLDLLPGHPACGFGRGQQSVFHESVDVREVVGVLVTRTGGVSYPAKGVGWGVEWDILHRDSDGVGSVFDG